MSVTPHSVRLPTVLSFSQLTNFPTVVPLALLGKRTRMAKLLAICALCWGIAATCFAAVRNFSGAYACRFIIGLGGKLTWHLS